MDAPELCAVEAGVDDGAGEFGAARSRSARGAVGIPFSKGALVCRLSSLPFLSFLRLSRSRPRGCRSLSSSRIVLITGGGH